MPSSCFMPLVQPSASLDDDDRNLVSGAVDTVRRVLKVSVDLPGLEHQAHLHLAVEQLSYRLVIEAVDAVLRAFGPNGMLGGHTRMVQQLSDRGADVARPFDEDLRHLVQALWRADPVHRQLDRRLIRRIEDVVDGPREREEILAVERSRVRVQQFIDQDAPGRITFSFDLFQLVDQVRIGARLSAEPLQDLKGPDGQVGLLAQQRDEPAIIRPGQRLERSDDAQGANPITRTARCSPAATTSASGRVSSQLPSISRTIPQRTDEARSAAPTPTSPPSMVWVMLTGAAATASIATTLPDAICCERACIGRTLRTPSYTHLTLPTNREV